MFDTNATEVPFIEFLFQTLVSGQDGVVIYTQAIECAQNPELRREWMRYLGETRRHQRALLDLFDALNIDPNARSADRVAAASTSTLLIETMCAARQSGSDAQVERIACDCVALAEARHDANWQLLGHVANSDGGPDHDLLRSTLATVESEQHYPLFHTRDWVRELGFDALGFAAILPPPGPLWRVGDSTQPIETSRARHA